MHCLLNQGDFSMRITAGSTKIFFLVLLLMLPVPAQAIPAITCHCFTDRSYAAARPAAADAYFLATTQNSFFAIVFNTDKKGLVMKKQQGTSADDLWIAYWVASKSGSAPDTLLQAKSKKETWKNVIAPLRLTPNVLGVKLSNAIQAHAPDAQLSEAVVDEVFSRYRLMGEHDLAAMRKSGATNQELILATVIAARTRQPANQLYLEVKTGARTWGAILTRAGIDTRNMQQEVSGILNLRPM